MRIILKRIIITLTHSSQVTFMLTGDCGSRENRDYKVYNQLAGATNGEVFNLMKSDVADVRFIL